MLIRLGCRLTFEFPKPTPLIALPNVHCSRFDDMVQQDDLVTHPRTPITGYRDGFENWCVRMLAPVGDFVLSTNGVFRDAGLPEPIALSARQHEV